MRGIHTKINAEVAFHPQLQKIIDDEVANNEEDQPDTNAYSENNRIEAEDTEDVV